MRIAYCVLLSVMLAFMVTGCPPQEPAKGSIQVLIEPVEAAEGGAHWRCEENEPWEDDEVEEELPVGLYTISFMDIDGWETPPDQEVQVQAGKALTVVTGVYTASAAMGSVKVTILPAAAVSAGARWNLDGGTWKSSGATIAQVAAGSHRLTYKPVASWIKPVTQLITLTANQALSQSATYTPQLTSGAMVVLGYNDLGMHCLGNDFSELMILPPYNNLHAQVIRRGEDPEIITSGITIKYAIQGNTHSADKTNFWTYVNPLFGVSLAANVGLTGNGLSGTMTSLASSGRSDWAAEGIPITPIEDSGRLNPYPLSTITVVQNAKNVVQTQAVVPVSWEMNCNLCHTSAGVSVGTNILQAHDRLHGTKLMTQKPVACGSCHAQPELGWTGNPNLHNLSRAMHGAHASRMGQISLSVGCYACHPGIKTQCQRDIHYSKGLTCTSCHGQMSDVAKASRIPWQTEPRCGQAGCHSRAGFEFEQSNTLFRNSKGHHGVNCESCHGSPHAITPTLKLEDNIQAVALQGHAGVINTCVVCHTKTPDDSFDHRLDD